MLPYYLVLRNLQFGFRSEEKYKEAAILLSTSESKVFELDGFKELEILKLPYYLVLRNPKMFNSYGIKKVIT